MTVDSEAAPSSMRIVSTIPELLLLLPAPAVFVLRGLSGSGKSTLARGLASVEPACRVVSADDYFTTPEGYAFNLARLGQAHADCFRRFLAALGDRAALLVVDNTNLAAWEASPYMLAASAMGYAATIVDVACSPKLAASRTTHNVPPEVLAMQSELFAREALPGAWHRVRWQPEPADSGATSGDRRNG